jgi:hypothetical protein
MRGQGGKAHSPSRAACVYPTTYIGRHRSVRYHRDGWRTRCLSMGPQSCRPILEVIVRRQPLIRPLSGP